MSGLADFSEDRSPQSNYMMRFDGDRNQGIGINNGNAFGNIEGNVYLNQQPKFLSLHQLPSDIADFTGRTTEIDTIRQQLLSGKSLVISAVAGMPGVGKSALAIHVAQQLAKSDFPDVQLYVDLRGADGDGLEPGEVLAGFLRAFGFNESNIPHDLQERASVYRSQLVGKRSIVLLDNAQDEAQVRPLLPGNAVVIITSRHVLGALSGVTVLQLKVLSKDDAYDLLAKLVGIERLQAEPEAAAEILRLCDGLPLAILIAGGTLKSKLHWQLADYGRKLADEKQRLEHLQLSDLSVRASFELSYQQLSPADGMLFSRLGILVGKDFGEELAAVLHDSDRPVIDGIERLIDAQLLDVTIDHRYHFHDLLRLFVREKLAESGSLEQQEAIKQQIVDWVCEQSHKMDTYLRPAERHQLVQQWIENRSVSADFDEQSLAISALTWFKQEQEQLLSAINWANDSERWEIVHSLVTSLGGFWEVRSLPDWDRICLVAVKAAQKSRNRYRESSSLNDLGSAYARLRKWDDAIESYERSLTIKRELGDSFHAEASSLHNLGNIYMELNQWDKAIDFHQRSLTIKQKFSDWHGESTSFQALGDVYQCQSRWDEAIESYQRSLSIKQEFGDLHGKGLSFIGLGHVYQYQSRWNEAIESYQHGLDICRKFGDWHGESIILGSLGRVYQCQCRWEKAIEYYHNSLSISRELGNQRNESNYLIGLGNVYQFQSRRDDAIECYQNSLNISGELGNLDSRSISLTGLGHVYESMSRWNEAIDCYQDALIIYRELANREGEGGSLYNLANVYRLKGQLDRSVDCYQRSLSIRREIGDRTGESSALNNLGGLYQLQDRLDEAIDCYQRSLTICRELKDRHEEAGILRNLGIVYEKQNRLDLTIVVWKEALSKLPEDAPEYLMMQEWLEEVQSLNNSWIGYYILDITSAR